ncbi:MAG: sugar phosphate isomerase/epimerase [Ruminococcaceae bacterium]|nr:sugar phosphate isomerase/epimerase [Oscillospiraceae bacterium]
MYKIGLSTCARPVAEEKFAGYSVAGITAMEISDTIDGYARLDYAGAAALAKKYGVELWSMHLPFGPFSVLDLSNPDLAGYTVEYYAELVRKGAEIGVKIFVIHPSGEPIKDEYRKIRMDTAKQSLAALAEIALQYGATIAVENLPRTCLGRNSEEIAELLSAHTALRACFDTNHLLAEKPVDFMREIGDKIITVHISDYDFVNERHWLPGEGKVDWCALLAAFREIGYSGAWIYEVELACPKTILRDRALTYEDFSKNANELFTGGEITVISRPKPNLGWWE